MTQRATTRRRFALLALLLVPALAAAGVAPGAPSADQATPGVVRLRFENDRVRVLETLSNPGDRENVHAHPANVVYVIAGGTLRITGVDGKSKDVEFKTGDTLWREPVVHSAENIGKTQLHAIMVELKR
jgi:mannose-6-phosphate isomerase-like protein (cupin superfamily)